MYDYGYDLRSWRCQSPGVLTLQVSVPYVYLIEAKTRQPYLADDIFKCIFLDENYCIFVKV